METTQAATARTPQGVFTPGHLVTFTELENRRALHGNPDDSIDGTSQADVVEVGADGVAVLENAKAGVRYLVTGIVDGTRHAVRCSGVAA